MGGSTLETGSLGAAKGENKGKCACPKKNLIEEEEDKEMRGTRSLFGPGLWEDTRRFRTGKNKPVARLLEEKKGGLNVFERSRNWGGRFHGPAPEVQRGKTRRPRGGGTGPRRDEGEIGETTSLFSGRGGRFCAPRKSGWGTSEPENQKTGEGAERGTQDWRTFLGERTQNVLRGKCSQNRRPGNHHDMLKKGRC